MLKERVIRKRRKDGNSKEKYVAGESKRNKFHRVEKKVNLSMIDSGGQNPSDIHVQVCISNDI